MANIEDVRGGRMRPTRQSRPGRETHGRRRFRHPGWQSRQIHGLPGENAHFRAPGCSKYQPRHDGKEASL